MKILDLRPLAVRIWSRRWDGEGGRGATDAAPGGAGPAAKFADALLGRRVGRRAAPPSRLAVVSVGNLAFGGTGKTPVVAALAQALAAQGRAGGVLTRGYGSRRAGPLRVDAADADAGDEARLLAETLAECGWVVVQARDRARGLELLQQTLAPGGVVILEDGHQTAKVGRHLDVLILDRWRRSASPGGTVLRPETGPVAPFGPWRESAAGAARAGIWLVETADPPLQGTDGQAVAGFTRRLTLEAAVGEMPPAAAWIGLSGIARPLVFEAGVRELRGGPAVLAIRCADHEPYSAPLRARVWDAIRRAGAPLTITTAKDWIKLREGWPEDLPLAVARQEVRWTGTRALPDLVGERCDACRE